MVWDMVKNINDMIKKNNHFMKFPNGQVSKYQPPALYNYTSLEVEDLLAGKVFNRNMLTEFSHKYEIFNVLALVLTRKMH